MKKKKMFISFMALVVLFAFAQMAMAYQIVINQGSYQSGSGGEFSINTTTPSGPGGLGWVLSLYSAYATTGTTSFQTFCLETTQYLGAYGTTYNAFLNTNAVLGGVGLGGDPVSIGTADLYYQFAKGTLSGYNYNGSPAQRQGSAAALQKTIWWLEGEQGYGDPNNIFSQYIHTKYLDVGADPFANNNNAFPVMAINVIKLDGTLSQDQLVVVPIPAAAWLLGSGLVGLVAIRRRMKK